MMRSLSSFPLFIDVIIQNNDETILFNRNSIYAVRTSYELYKEGGEFIYIHVYIHQHDGWVVDLR